MSNLFKTDDAERAAYQAALQAVNAEAALHFHDRNWRAERSQEMGRKTYEGFIQDSLIEMFAETERLPLGGRSYVKDVKGMKAFWTAKGGYIQESFLQSDVWEVPSDMVGFSTNELVEKLETNFGETASTLVELGRLRLDGAVNERLFATMQAAVPSGSASYSSGAGLSLTALNAAIAGVEDASNTVGVPITIVGRATMTRQILDGLAAGGASFLQETNEEIRRTGRLGVYRGANVVTLNNHRDGNGKSFFPANELWVISPNAAKVAFYGGPRTYENVDRNGYWEYVMSINAGVLVHHTDRVRRIVDTSLAP